MIPDHKDSHFGIRGNRLVGGNSDGFILAIYLNVLGRRDRYPRKQNKHKHFSIHDHLLKKLCTVLETSTRKINDGIR